MYGRASLLSAFLGFPGLDSRENAPLLSGGPFLRGAFRRSGVFRLSPTLPIYPVQNPVQTRRQRAFLDRGSVHHLAASRIYLDHAGMRPQE